MPGLRFHIAVGGDVSVTKAGQRRLSGDGSAVAIGGTALDKPFQAGMRAGDRARRDPFIFRKDYPFIIIRRGL
jgi:hypothetical protein